MTHPPALKSSFTRTTFFENEVRKENLLGQGNTPAFLPLGKLKGNLRCNLKVHQCLPLPSGTHGHIHCFSSPPWLLPLPRHFLCMDYSTASRVPCFTLSLMLCFLCLELLWLPRQTACPKRTKIRVRPYILGTNILHILGLGNKMHELLKQYPTNY